MNRLGRPLILTLMTLVMTLLATFSSTVFAQTTPLTRIFSIAPHPDLKGLWVDQDLLETYQIETNPFLGSLLKNLSDDEQDAALSAFVKKRNQATLQDFYRTTGQSKFAPNSVHSLTRDQARQVLTTLADHPITGEKGIPLYDPNREIGFCFGRAAFVHAELLRLGIDPSSIAKIFAAGSLARAGMNWDYHVATIVRATEGSWWVIDSLMTDVVSLEEWMPLVQEWDRNPSSPTLRFYLADPSKFQTLQGSYSENKLFDPLYRSYFFDLLIWFSSRPSAN